ncbi:MAG: histidine--tRNA ligase [Pyrinomonadaceae bacterium]
MELTKPARGMRDFLPADVRRREYVIRIIKNVYESYGFEPLETPAVENIDTLLGKYGEEGNQLIFKILKRGAHEATGEADLALRYDLTVPLARVIAEYQSQLPKFFKRYQIQPVWRADRPARGRFREFYQCDLDAIGSTSVAIEAEICAAAGEVFTQLGFNDFTIRFNHRQLLAGLLDQAGVAPEKHAQALMAIDKLEKIGAKQVAEEFSERGIPGDAAKKLLELFADACDNTASAETETMFEKLSGFLGNHQSGAQGLTDLKKIFELSRATGHATGIATKLQIDPTLARGLSYYTGAIMEIRVPDLAGSLGGGGRYDNLIGMFLGRDIPACGFSLGLERIIVIMTERGMFPKNLKTSSDVLVTLWDESSVARGLSLARELRQTGLKVEIYPESDKLSRQFKYASSLGISFVTVVGPDEEAKNEVAFKDLTSGEQKSFPRAEVGRLLVERLKQVEKS